MRRALWIGLALLITVYLGLIAAFVTTVPSVDPDLNRPEGGVMVAIAPMGLEPTAYRLTTEVVVLPDASLLDENGYLRQRMEIMLAPSFGNEPIVLEAGRPPRTTSLAMPLLGYVELWPFDRYQLEFVDAYACLDSCATGEDIPTAVTFVGTVPGWQVHQQGEDGMIDQVVIDRSPSVVLFGLVIVAVLILGAVLALRVAILSVRRKIALQPAFFGWFAALLFATVPLRTFFPGSPPSGSLVDYVVVIWVILAYMVSLAMYVHAWTRQPRE